MNWIVLAEAASDPALWERAIDKYGFPLVVCIALGAFIWWLMRSHRDERKDLVSTIQASNNEVIKARTDATALMTEAYKQNLEVGRKQSEATAQHASAAMDLSKSVQDLRRDLMGSSDRRRAV